MSADYAKKATLAGLIPWLPLAERKGIILAAPQSERGWGSIGYSILLSSLSRLDRELHIDPDRVYVTGHSMGGHLSWRSAIHIPDRFGAVSPMSGGYDYVKDKQVFTMVNVPGYATCGTKERGELYDIDKFDRIIGKFMARAQLRLEAGGKAGRARDFQR